MFMQAWTGLKGFIVLKHIYKLYPKQLADNYLYALANNQLMTIIKIHCLIEKTTLKSELLYMNPILICIKTL